MVISDEPRPGRPTFTTTENKVDAMHIMILENRRIAATVIVETLAISRERVGHIIHILDMGKLSEKRVLEYLNTDQKRIRVTTSKAILNQFAVGEADFMARLVTMDEAWLHHFDLHTKQ
ncbi:uncharacterized protein LOC106867207 [Octopus bimaculoides]|uniref:uncharacterized protein LOC106867207 n=1 Tax=Octopus bimaculoides TaxID=37653 RepID=UPI00071CC17F|nr:uncharacterized protein LOC106867207 [Octopus bimaculoides]|eukprot:XP_014767504.1 PREDICTED: uncharacterized protein LOC106867207 [Octopus bimaculoides]